MISLLLVAILVAFAGNAGAQPYGSASGEEALTARVLADVFQESNGIDSAVTLIVLWRGETFWMRRDTSSSLSGRSGGGSRSMATSGGVTSVDYNRTAGGITRRINFDRSAGRVIIDARDTLAARADSTLIIMVDRIDTVGGPPVVTSIHVARVPAITVAPSREIPTREAYERLIREFMETGVAETNFSRFLATIAVVREFLK
jgi:hypothetical protein